MKKQTLIFAAISLISFPGNAQSFGNLLKNAEKTVETKVQPSSKTSSGNTNFTQSEAGSAIKQALQNGITNSVNVLSAENGYYGNSLVKIPFPSEVQGVANALQKAGMGSLVDKFVLQMNRSAEGAATQALPIFGSAITNMSISDAVNLVTNKQQDAATQFLKNATYTQLKTTFKPQIQAALDKTGTPAAWTKVTEMYNKIIPFAQPINTDLTDYVTGKALDGLFVMVAQEEAKIRSNPAAQTTDLLKKVFGSLIK